MSSALPEKLLPWIKVLLRFVGIIGDMAKSTTYTVEFGRWDRMLGCAFSNGDKVRITKAPTGLPTLRGEVWAVRVRDNAGPWLIRRDSLKKVSENSK